ncbi:MAG TPA: C1 family peptidase [Bacteroidota bacterium]|nr:C1 family peptidase [Bacteroidota bacterium]
MNQRIITIIAFICIIPSVMHAQIERRDTALFVEPKSEFWDSITTSLDKFYKKETPPKKVLRVDFSKYNPPKSTDEFKQYWHNKPVSQANSGMCWCFSTTSFLESEIYRTTKREVKLSELYTVYWEYVEKARGFVRARGNQTFGEGSESEAVLRSWEHHGIVPEEAYTGLLNGQPFHDHTKLFAELDTYLKSLKASNAWDEDAAEHTVRAILNHYIGAPPEKISVNGKEVTPKEYLEKTLKLNLNDYIELTSLSDRPYYAWNEYDVDDNWWHSKNYFNVPLDVFMNAIKTAIRNGYTTVIGGDVSEPGIEGHAGIAVIPSFDIPSQYIDENARIFRYKNGTTGDDHGIHLVGYAEKGGRDWYLIKDSGAGSRNNSHPGYFFFEEDFVKLKMLTAMFPKSALPEIIAKLPK